MQATPQSQVSTATQTHPASNVLLFPCAWSAVATTSKLDPADRVLVQVLRRLLSRSRLAGREDVDRMCALIAVDPLVSAERFGLALFKVLPQAARRRLEFHSPSARSPSVDEMWLVRLIRAAQRRDETNVSALIGFRIRREETRRIRFLVTGLAEVVDELVFNVR